jgi:hypothetical protein
VPSSADACGGRSRSHRQRHIASHNQSACVDEDIAELIEALWRAGCSTLFTCVDLSEEGWAQLAFADSRSLERAYETLAELIARIDDREMRHRLDGTEQSCEYGPDGSTITYHQPVTVLWRADARHDLAWLAGSGPPATLQFTLWMPCSDALTLNQLLVEGVPTPPPA